MARMSEAPTPDSGTVERFRALMLPHLDAAYGFARWLTGADHDAEDVVQEAYLRALRYFDSYAGGDPRSWLLTIVRNTCFRWLRENRPAQLVPLPDDADAEPLAADPSWLADGDDPERALIARGERALLDRLIADLPPVFREVIVLRELQELSYREIAAIVDAPAGTVMSRLARARRQLQRGWRRREAAEGARGL